VDAVLLRPVEVIAALGLLLTVSTQTHAAIVCRENPSYAHHPSTAHFRTASACSSKKGVKCVPRRATTRKQMEQVATLEAEK
jgi:hypothetical protein